MRLLYFVSLVSLVSCNVSTKPPPRISDVEEMIKMINESTFRDYPDYEPMGWGRDTNVNPATLAPEIQNSLNPAAAASYQVSTPPVQRNMPQIQQTPPARQHRIQGNMHTWNRNSGNDEMQRYGAANERGYPQYSNAASFQSNVHATPPPQFMPRQQMPYPPNNYQSGSNNQFGNYFSPSRQQQNMISNNNFAQARMQRSRMSMSPSQPFQQMPAFPQHNPSPYGYSYAGYIDRQARRFPVMIYSLVQCVPCQRAKHLLATTYPDVASHYLELVGDEEWQRQLQVDLLRKTGAVTFPYIYVCGEYIGGSSDLYEMHRSGQLRSVLQTCPQGVPGQGGPQNNA